MTDPITPRQPGYPDTAYHVYRRWHRAGDRSNRSVYNAIRQAWAAGAQDEADERQKGRAPAALEVMTAIDGFAQWDNLADKDHAYFASQAAEIYLAGQPLRRRLLHAWRVLRPRWRLARSTR